MCTVKFCVWHSSCIHSCLTPGEQGAPGKDPGQSHTVTRNILQEMEGTELRTLYSSLQGCGAAMTALCLDLAYDALVSGNKSRVPTLAPRCHMTYLTHPVLSASPCSLLSPTLQSASGPLYQLHLFLCRSLHSPFTAQPCQAFPLPSGTSNNVPALCFSALGPGAQGHGCLHLLSVSLLDCQLHH